MGLRCCRRARPLGSAGRCPPCPAAAQTAATAAGGARAAASEPEDWLVADDRATRGVSTAMNEATNVNGHCQQRKEPPQPQS